MLYALGLILFFVFASSGCVQTKDEQITVVCRDITNPDLITTFVLEPYTGRVGSNILSDQESPSFNWYMDLVVTEAKFIFKSNGGHETEIDRFTGEMSTAFTPGGSMVKVGICDSAEDKRF